MTTDIFVSQVLTSVMDALKVESVEEAMAVEVMEVAEFALTMALTPFPLKVVFATWMGTWLESRITIAIRLP
jgi:hypothetical protein